MTAVDPRLFPRRVRYAALLTVNVYVFMGNMYSSGIATGFESLGKDLHVDNSKLSDLATYSTIYERDEEPEVIDDFEKDAFGHIEAVQTLQSQVGDRVELDYGEYMKGLFTFHITKEAKEKGVLKHLAYLFVLPFPMLLVPGVLIASIMYGVVLGGIVAISTLAPTIFGVPPYLFSSAGLGLFTLSSFVGILIAWPIAGPLTDIFSRWMRRRNNNVHKPEHRLPALIIPFLVSPVGLVVFGYTVARSANYVQPAVGAAINAAGLTLVPSVMLSYVVDSYPHASGEALVLVNASKNIVAFGISSSAYTWMYSSGVANMFYELAGIQWAVIGLGLPLYFAGPWLRARTNQLL